MMQGLTGLTTQGPDQAPPRLAFARAMAFAREYANTFRCTAFCSATAASYATFTVSAFHLNTYLHLDTYVHFHFIDQRPSNVLSRDTSQSRHPLPTIAVRRVITPLLKVVHILTV